MAKSLLLKLAAIVVLCMVLFSLAFAQYMGAFSRVQVTEGEVGPFFIVYKEHRGSYAQGAKTIKEIVRALSAVGIEKVRGFGIYYDDPNKVAEADLRSEVGAIIEEEDKTRAEKVIAQFRTRTFPKQEGVSAFFPLRNSLSLFLGPMRVYPAFHSYLVQRAKEPLFSIEIYDPSMIVYFMPTKIPVIARPKAEAISPKGRD